MDGDTFVSALLSVIGYTAKEISRPVLNGVAMEFGDRVTVAAADGFRLAVRELRLGFPQPAGVSQVVVIPAEAVRVLGKLWKKAPGTAQVDLFADIAQMAVAKRPMEVAVNAAYIQARFGHVTLLTKLIQGTFPNYRQLIPNEFTSRVRVLDRDLERGCRAIEQVAKGGNNIVRLAWSDSTLSLSARAEETGEMNLSVPVMTEGGEGKTALSVQYLLAYLRGKEGMVEICVNTPSSPILFHHSGAPLVVVMPMFVQWDGEAPKQPQAAAAQGGGEETAATAATPEPTVAVAEGDEGGTPVEEVASEPAPEAKAPAEEAKPQQKRRGRKKQK